MIENWIKRMATLQAVVIIAILGWGAWQGVAAINSAPAQQRLRPTLTMEAFLAGRFAAAVNYVMAHNLPVDPYVRAAGGFFRWRLFNSGGPQVRVGCNDWLFLTEELRPWPDAAAAMAERVAGLARIRERLAAQNITLLVAIVPDKARVQAEQLCGAPLSAQAAERHAELVTAFRAGGITPIPLLEPLRALAAQRPAYWRTDTHWNQEGAALAATRIAEAARGLNFDRPGGFTTRFAAEETNGPGDLLRLMGLDIMPDGWRPAPDRQHLATTTAPAPATGGLLDDEASPQVALIGSSYSLNANFHGFLQEALGAAVTNLAQAGGGFAGAARSYFAGATFREAPPRVIIWEVLERAMAQPVGEEERAFLAQ
ncbi:cell division protein FtsQ [Sediminicoccus sp. KRV36]|uniref:alginate O-acetyltransferase AlgX-related protein n=1 Tax=Sediminicoccus sp. KRV36 TaxID=3133721 RepID=UPI00200CD5F5|nr:cell division protein FtsQ [Sediminicoccus rosea]UPY36997.1 cell division protein FtsQ [Sediminicoccus rosea]